jgi:hypothetical protein
MAKRLNYLDIRQEGAMKNFRIIPAAVLAVTALASTACATGYASQGPYGSRGGYNDGVYARNIERRAFDNGYREGIRQGERDGRSNRRYDPSRHSEWRDANDGFRREYGDHNLYRRDFRSGFEQGYREAYRQNGRGYYRR